MLLMQNKLTKLLTTADRPVDAAKELVRNILSHSNDRDTQLSMIAEDPVAVQGAVLNILTDMSEVQENRKIALDNWKISRAAVEEEQRRAAQATFIKNVHTTADSAVDELSQAGNFLLSQVPDNPEWNVGVERRINAAKGILQSADPKTLVKYVVDGVTASDMRTLYLHLAQAYKTLQAEASAIVGHQPNIGGSAEALPAQPARRQGQSSNEILDNLFGADSV
jgi:hypothetical protein